MDNIKEGDVVKLRPNAVSYNGRIISSSLKKGTWHVRKVRGDRVWLEFDSGVAHERAALTVNRKNIIR